LSFSLAVATSVIIGGVAELTIGTNFPAQGLKVGDTGIYTGVATFIVGMTALFSVFGDKRATIPSSKRNWCSGINKNYATKANITARSVNSAGHSLCRQIIKDKRYAPHRFTPLPCDCGYHGQKRHHRA
jgi:hypothetical protein